MKFQRQLIGGKWQFWIHGSKVTAEEYAKELRLHAAFFGSTDELVLAPAEKSPAARTTTSATWLDGCGSPGCAECAKVAP